MWRIAAATLLGITPLAALLAIYWSSSDGFCTVCTLHGQWRLFRMPNAEPPRTPSELCETDVRDLMIIEFTDDEERLALHVQSPLEATRSVVFDRELLHEVFTIGEVSFQTSVDGWPSHEFTVDTISEGKDFFVILHVAGSMVAGSYISCPLP
ncbi:MAG: hypothetical protein AAFQ81_10835 [Pseudomonadota bacterium]